MQTIQHSQQKGTNHSLDELVGIRVMPRLNVAEYHCEPAYRAVCERLIQEKRVLGFCLFGGRVEEVATLTKRLQQIARDSLQRSLLFSADCEWGLTMRFVGGTEFPDAMAIARTGDPSLATAIAQAIGSEMREVGVNWNFAPVADINSNPGNPIINVRSFGEQAEIVLPFLVAQIGGYRAARVASTAKHFPGHGDTSVDSHRELPTLSLTEQAFHSRELKPFASAIAAGVDAIMLGHISTPQLASALGAVGETTQLPATLSRWIAHDLLRQKMGFTGVSVTDAMEMSAITKHWGDAAASLMAIKASVDVVLMPLDAEGAIEHILQHVDGLSFKELKQSHARITALMNRVATGDDGEWQNEHPAHVALAREAATQALEVRGTLEQFRDVPLVFIVDDRPVALERARTMLPALRELGLTIQGDVFTPKMMIEHPNAEIQRARGIVVLSRARGFAGAGTSSVTMTEALRTFREEHAPLEAAMFIGSPYLDRECTIAPNAAVIKTYSDSHYSIEALINLISN